MEIDCVLKMLIVCVHIIRNMFGRNHPNVMKPIQVVHSLQKVGSRTPTRKSGYVETVDYRSIGRPTKWMMTYTQTETKHGLSLSSFIPDTIDYDIAPTNTLG
jgi:hypothetical protein